MHKVDGFQWMRGRSLVVLVGTVTACEFEPVRTSNNPVIWDSAGIEIVESPEHPKTIPWAISSEPTVRIDESVQGMPAQFSRIGGVVRGPSGEIGVLESATAELRVFGPDGTHLRTFGGLGDGPGELRIPRGLESLLGDTLVVFEMAEFRLEYFTWNGEYGGSSSVSGRSEHPTVDWSGSCPSTFPLLPGGAVLRCIDDPDEAQPPSGIESGTGRVLSVRMVAIPRGESQLDTLGRYRGNEYFVVSLPDGGIVDGTLPHLSRGYLATGKSPDHLYVAENPDYSIEVWTPTGQLRRIIRRSHTPFELTQAALDAEIALALDGAPGQVRSRAADLLRDRRTLPSIWGLAAGPGGELWVKRASQEATVGAAVYDVFDGRGHFIGSAHLARDVEILSVTAESILALHKDEFDVESLEVYQLTR